MQFKEIGVDTITYVKDSMRKITIISGSIEKEAEKSKRRIAKLNTGDNSGNDGLNFKGKPLNEFGFFVYEKDF